MKYQEPKLSLLSAVSKSPSILSATSNIKSSPMEFLSTLSPSMMSAVSNSLSVLSTTSKIKKRLVHDDVDHRVMMKPKQNDPKLAAYEIDWLDSSATNNKCLKYAHIKKLPSTQEGKLSFLLSKFETSDIKTACANAIGRVGKPAKTVCYPLPLCKEKLVKSFLELISGKSSIMADHSKDSFR